MIVSPGGYTTGKVHSLAFAGAEIATIRTADGGRIGLDLGMQYEVVALPDDPVRGPYKVSTRKYMYTVKSPPDGEVLAWHWHPSTSGNAGHEPHVHVGTRELGPESLLKKKMHIPTGRVSIEEVIRFCITELGGVPQRQDWLSVLADSEDLFNMFRTWPQPAAPAAGK